MKETIRPTFLLSFFFFSFLIFFSYFLLFSFLFFFSFRRPGAYLIFFAAVDWSPHNYEALSELEKRLTATGFLRLKSGRTFLGEIRRIQRDGMHVLNHGISNIPLYLQTDPVLSERGDLVGAFYEDILNIVTSKKSVPLTAARRTSVSVSVRDYDGSVSICPSLPQTSKGQDTTTDTDSDTHTDTHTVTATHTDSDTHTAPDTHTAAHTHTATHTATATAAHTAPATHTHTDTDTGVVLITQYFKNPSPDSSQQRDIDKALGLNVGNSYISLIILLTEELLTIPGTVHTHTRTRTHKHTCTSLIIFHLF